MITRARGRARLTDERGAILIQVAVSLLALLALSAFVFDYGVLWSSRAQAQNAADAGALSGAISLAFEDPADLDGARAKALAVAARQQGVGRGTDVTAADVTFPACPPDPGHAGRHLREGGRVQEPASGRQPAADVLRAAGRHHRAGRSRNSDREGPVGDKANCVKPWAIPDKWNDLLDNPRGRPTVRGRPMTTSSATFRTEKRASCCRRPISTFPRA